MDCKKSEVDFRWDIQKGGGTVWTSLVTPAVQSALRMV